MGVGVMLVVITTLLTALIALPAILSLLGDDVDALRLPFMRPRHPPSQRRRRVWAAEPLHSIMRRPVIWLTIAVVALLAVAAPVFMKRAEQHRQCGAPPRQRIRQAGLGHRL